MDVNFKKWLRKQNLDTFQELYAIALEGNHGLDAVKAWLNGEPEWFDELCQEMIKFLMPPPTA